MTIFFDIPRKLRNSVDFCFRFTPVISLLSAHEKATNVCERYSVLPASLVEFIGEAHKLELLAKQGKICLWDGNRSFYFVWSCR